MNAKDRTTLIESCPPERADLLVSIREHVRRALQAVIDEELVAALGAARHERIEGRRGYRNGSQVRSIVTQSGPATLEVPRARIQDETGRVREWRSELVPRYQRRTAAVDAALLGCYLAGSNQRRIRKALWPLLGEANLSKSAISRIVGRLEKHFEAWRQRDLKEEGVVYLYLDGLRLPVRVARRVVSVPVLAALGVREDGSKVLLALQVAGSESAAGWKTIVTDLSARGLAAPLLVILDGAKGLERAVSECWPGSAQQRCTRHKLENLLGYAPEHCQAELKRDYRGIVDADSQATAKTRYQAFLKKWTALVPEVAHSLEEAGERLLTFFRFPRCQWKSLRTTNQLERLNGEFRRRTKTQGSFRNETSALVLLWGLIAFGQVRLRKIDGFEAMGRAIRSLQSAA